MFEIKSENKKPFSLFTYIDDALFEFKVMGEAKEEIHNKWDCGNTADCTKEWQIV